MQIKFKKLNPEAKVPQHSKPGDAGVDITATWKQEIDKNIVYGTHLAVEIPENHVGLLFPRSSLTNYDLSLGNHVGVIDSGYRGEILFKFKRLEVSKFCKEYQPGDRIGQLVIVPFVKIEGVEVGELSQTERGQTGYGSSGT